MRCGTWYFNGTLLRKTLARFWPLWSLYGLIWFYALPVRCLMQRGYGAGAPVSRAAAFAADVPELVPELGLFLAVTFGLAAATAAFSYLFNARASGLMHALPIRREGLFLTHYAAGLIGLLAPHGIVWLMTLAAEASLGAVDLGAAMIWLIGQSALCFIFYSGAVFCAVLAGQILALPVYYGLLNSAVAALAAMIQYLCSKFLFGFVGLGDREWDALVWLTPVARIVTDVGWDRTEKPRFEGAGVLAVYAAAALALTIAALLIYRRRHAETAGDVVAVPALQPVFKYGVALCAGLCFGLLLHEMFSLGGNTGLAVNLLVWTAIGYFAAEMLLKKTFRVFAGAWKGCIAALLVMGAAIAVVGLDVTGFVARVPEAAQVETVTVDAGHSVPYDDGSYIRDTEINDPAAVEKVIELHRAIVAAGEEGETSGADAIYLQLQVAYRLKDGRKLTRKYTVPAEKGTALAETAQAFLCDPAMVEAAYDLERVDPDELVSYSVENLADGAGNLYLRYDGEEMDADGGRKGARLLYDAVRADFAAGTLGRRYLFDDDPEREQNTYAADLCLRWNGETETVIEWDGTARSYQNSYDLTVTLTPQAENTLRVLAELGAVKDGQLRPYGEERADRLRK